jgi:hypothetical protein
MFEYAVLGITAMCLLNIAAHAGAAARNSAAAPLVFRWLPAAVAAGAAAALALGGIAFLLSLAASG